MRFYHYTLLYVILFMLVFVQISYVISVYETAVDEHMEMEKKFTNAVDAAAMSLVFRESDGLLTADRDAAVEAFFSSMYSSLGIADDPEARKEFTMYIPVFVAVLNDGYSLLSFAEYIDASGGISYTRQWTETKAYAFADNLFTYRFMLDGSVTLYDREKVINGTECIFTATQKELEQGSLYQKVRASYPDLFLFDKESYENVRKAAITDCIEESLRYEFNVHNQIAQNYDIDYGFSIPVIDNARWSRSIDAPSLLVTIQGYPLYAGNSLYFNQFSFVGASISKATTYYIETGCGSGGWYSLYHRFDCPYIGKEGTADWANCYYDVKELADLGCYACKYCLPFGVHKPDSLSDPQE